VGGCDVLAVREGEPPVLVVCELKPHLRHPRAEPSAAKAQTLGSMPENCGRVRRWAKGA